VQYDTKVEEAFIARAIQEREVNSIRQQQQYSDPPADALTPVAPTSSPSEAASVMKPSSSQSAPVSVHNPVPVGDISHGGQGHSAFELIKGSSILTPIPAMSAGGSLPTGNASGSALRNIDLKDFETEQDPFENLSLRVINDREELNKVFHVTSPPSQQPSAATLAMSAPSAVVKSEPTVNAQSSSLFDYSTSNVTNGLDAASLNWIRCQPVPRWPLSGHNVVNTRNEVTNQHHNPHIGPVSGSFVDRANFPSSGASNLVLSNFQPPQQPASTSMLRSAKSTPDISRLANDYDVVSARRTPPPVSTDWTAMVESQNREKVSRYLCYFSIHYFKSHLKICTLSTLYLKYACAV